MHVIFLLVVFVFLMALSPAMAMPTDLEGLRGRGKVKHNPISSSKIADLGSAIKKKPIPPWHQQKNEQPTPAACNLCEKPFVIVLSTGRAGSTSIMHMINALPGISISGEHDGQLAVLEGMGKKVWRTQSLDYIAAWASRHVELNAFLHNWYCHIQQWYYSTTGLDSDYKRSPVRGFKEIRYTDEHMFTFLTTVFPCARFVINYRQLEDMPRLVTSFQRGQMDDTVKSSLDSHHPQSQNQNQSKSQNQNQNQSPNLLASKLFNKTSNLMQFGRPGSSTANTSSFHMPLHAFSDINRWNALARYLGSTCTFKRALTHHHSGAEKQGTFIEDQSGGNDLVQC